VVFTTSTVAFTQSHERTVPSRSWMRIPARSSVPTRSAHASPSPARAGVPDPRQQPRAARRARERLTGAAVTDQDGPTPIRSSHA
jgi:hypothetical protein